MIVQEVFDYKRMTASGVLFATTGQVAGFLCTTAGSVALKEGTDGTGADIVSTIAVTPGQFVPMPFSCGAGAYAVLTGGCIGTFATGK
jgi:hypothetical protein